MNQQILIPRIGEVLLYISLWLSGYVLAGISTQIQALEAQSAAEALLTRPLQRSSTHKKREVVRRPAGHREMGICKRKCAKGKQQEFLPNVSGTLVMISLNCPSFQASVGWFIIVMMALSYSSYLSYRKTNSPQRWACSAALNTYGERKRETGRAEPGNGGTALRHQPTSLVSGGSSFSWTTCLRSVCHGP